MGGLGFNLEILTALGLGFFFLILVAGIVLTVLPFWLIFRKAGYSGALSLLMLIPVANIVMLFFLAFSKWPIEQKLDEFEMNQEIDRRTTYQQR